MTAESATPLNDSDNEISLLRERVAQLERELAASRQYDHELPDTQAFALIAEHIQEVFWIVDARTRHVLYVSSGFEQMWGISRAAVMADPDAWLNMVHPEDRAQALAGIIPQDLPKGARFAASEQAYRIVRHDGTMRWIHNRAFPVYENGSVVRLVGIAADITERKEVEQALRISESRFRAMVEQAPLSVQIVRPDGFTVQVNHAWEKLWGLSLDKLRDYNMLEDPQLERSGILPYIKRAFAGEATLAPAIMYDPTETIPAGSDYIDPRRWVTAVIYPVKDEQGTVTEIVLIHQDITEQTLAEMALRDSEERYRLLVEMSPLSIVVHSLGKVAYVNPAGAQLIGAADPGDLIGRNVLDFIHPDDRKAVMERMQAGYASRTPAPSREERLIRLDGSLLDVEIVGMPTQFIGKPAVQTIITDITARKHYSETQRYLVEASRVMTESLDFETALDNLTRLIVPQLADWAFVDMIQPDKSIRRLALVAANPVKADLLRAVEKWHRLDNEAQQPAAQAIRNAKSVLIPAFTEEELARGIVDEEHGRLVRQLEPFSTVAVPIRSRGEILGVLVFTSSESKRTYTTQDLELAEELARRATIAIENARLYREAQEAIRARDEFLSVAAHELKTPVTSLRGFSQTLLRRAHKTGTLDASQVMSALETMNAQASKLGNLVSQLLDVSRIASGRLQLERQSTDIGAMLRTLANNAQIKPDLHEIRVEVHAPLSGVVDPIRLEQVISNLIDNAIKFSPDGGLIEIVGAVEDDTTICISVRDHGIGVAPDECERIFDRYYQAQGSSYGGMGLGLYISREIVEMHGGTIRAESPDGGGTRFVITLPIQPAE